jgi:hypothetical protein
MSRLTVTALFIVMAVLAAAAPVAARGPVALGISDPKGGNMDVLDAHISAIGQTPALWSLWSNWGSRGGFDACRVGFNCRFPTAKVEALHDRGIVPVIWWQPTDPARPTSGQYPRYKRIINGTHDAYIRQFAREAKAAGKRSGLPVVIRFAHEAKGQWFPWAIGRFDNTKQNYKQAWKHVVKIFKDVGARRYARFMWSHVKPHADVYPGDRYVDYIGITVLNFGSDRKQGWTLMQGKVRNSAAAAWKFTKKPIILAEVASHYRGGNRFGGKAEWLRSGYLSAYRINRVKAIMYLDTNQPQLSRFNHPDWRLIKPDNGSAQEMYAWLAAKPKFQGQIQ